MFLVIFSTLSGIGIALFPWTEGKITLSVSAIYVAIMNINVTLVISVIVSAVPTTLRWTCILCVILTYYSNVVLMFLISDLMGRTVYFSANLIWFGCFFDRGMAVNMVMMFGRIGVISGNLFIPTLVAVSCELSFMTLALFHFSEWKTKI